ncbi:exodeoxyribonuclease V subunit gamma [Geobacter hydrogenophilus]|uniref:RecBCD enzyme subunit RecC n=1 Tax=Geobacter hydrogenophilus TaxID=40983 RepID=A0A9W6G227_9BACT|nr:exodeoxyribonuclease V subunit gamma [Geobacter hydrogenophilus]MBT0893197.1 exodeoxyribonuclease V subunit gamma [Geobacter hydrogenophilus]GLI38958.1 RecBCD enzyme subunit RecC [Geobacter hydrogenophilus]
MSLSLYSSNRMEHLVARLVEVLRRPLADPLAPEVIVVQSKGMQRWLAMELATAQGVWANGAYPFPNAFVWDLFRKALPELPATSPFDPAVLSWRIMGLLPAFLDQSAFAPLAGYLTGGQRELKLYQLAGKIADTFDQYTIFRPGMITRWEKGSEDHWQAILWRALAEQGRGLHREAVRSEFLRRLARGEVDTPLLPERITVFGISYLPQFHLDVFRRIADVTEVNLFVMGPCREYWADILPERIIARLSPEEREVRIEGNPLLASLGLLGKEFSDTLVELGATAGCDTDLYGETPDTTLLDMVQNDILRLEGSGGEKRPVTAADRSVLISSCHSPMREVEVLHDTLLNLFATSGDLTPRDILVMTPDIETYAPYISAVFDGCQDPRLKIPYSIADRSIRREGGLAETFLAILDLPGKRFPVTGVTEILASPMVHARFGLDAGHLELIRTWLEETRIRWGMDEEERRRAGFPPYREHSWRAGLDRLLLGYAMPEEDGRMVNGILPFDAMEGEGPAVLGRFAGFVEGLHALVDELERPRTLTEWVRLCRRILDDFFAPGEEGAFDLAALNGILAELETVRDEAEFGGEVELPVIRAWLRGRLDREVRGLGFMTGGVTFCAMLPMRSIPFAVIALLGMNDGAFPRQNRPPGFDLIARDRRRGDRSLRDEDRYLFLEALLSARRHFIISYTGQSIRDNSTLPPSVLVDEFLDYLGRRFMDGSPDFPKNLVTQHRLQPFSPAYFTGAGTLFSYSEENRKAVAQRQKGSAPVPSFMTEPLPEPPEELLTVSLAGLLSFFDNPARYFVRTRLGIRLDELPPSLDDREPFELDSLDAFRLKGEMLDLALAGRDPVEIFPVARARGVLPPARQGELMFRGLDDGVRELAGRIKELIGGRAPMDSLPVDLAIGPYRITGTLGDIWPDALLRHRGAKLSGRDQVRLWIEHLVLNALIREGYPASSIFVATDASLCLVPVKESLAHLETLVGLYGKGLREPLRFFPRTAAAYAKKWELSAARTAWEGEFFPERDDPYYRLCFGATDPLDGEFARIARAVFEPLTDHRQGRGE